MRTTQIRNIDALYHDCWRICNDSLKTDVALLYPPHVIAIGEIIQLINCPYFDLASVMIAVMITNRENDKDICNWLSEFSADFEKVFEVIQMIMTMYKLVKSYDEKTQIEGLLKRLPRPTVAQPNGIHSSHPLLKLKIDSKYR